jgi:outer membrane receptor for ferrienterochelin and colicins
MTKRSLSPLLLGLFVLVNPARTPGQDQPGHRNLLDMSLEELMNVEIDSVYGASGYKQKVVDAPASITIVTADEIKRYGYRTLGDILRSVPGFYVTSDRVYSYAGVRGFGPPGDYNTRILLLIDGHRTNDVVYNAGYLDMDFPVDVDLIDRVEVIRGPNSSIYIASALLGVVNVVTKHGRELQGVSISEELASYETDKTRLTYGSRLKNGLEMLISGTYYGSDGPEKLYYPEFNSPTTNNGVALNSDGTRTYQEFAKLSYRGWTLETAYDSWQQRDPTASYGSIFNDPEENIGMNNGYADLSYDHHFGSDWGYLARVYYDNDRDMGTYPYDYSASGGVSHAVNHDPSSGQAVGVSFSISKSLPRDQTLVMGGEYRDNFQEDQYNYDAQPYVEYLNSRQSSDLWGLHLQDEIPIRRDLELDLGLSYDHYSTFGGTTNPRAALIYKPREGTTFKFLYGQSFRAPTPFELFYAIPGEEANPYLKPETARTTEVVWEQALASSFRLNVSGYYYPVRQIITAVTDPVSGSLVYQNDGGVDLKGAEISLSRQSRSGLEAGFSFSLQDAKSPAGPLVDSPRVLGQANLSVPLFHKKVFASTNLQYVSRRRTPSGSFAGAYVLPNFTLSTPKDIRGWELSVSVYNAFNQLFDDPASVAHVQDLIPQDGRTFRLKLVYHF